MMTNSRTIQNFLNYFAYAGRMATKWNSSALTARLRLSDVLETAPTSGFVAATRLQLLDITADVDRGVLSPEQAERLLTTLADHLTRQENPI